MYARAGITDVMEFYRKKFAHDVSFDFSERPINFYNIEYFKQVWVYSKVNPNSRILDFGCGSGTLTILKHKGCELSGIDYSNEALKIAVEKNGYDHIFCGEIFDCNFSRQSFDYIVSLDVFGHIEFEQKDAVIAKLKEFLKPNGIMLHGIECGPVLYEQMSAAEYANYVAVDGHVGLEGKAPNMERFRRFFSHVRGEVRYEVIHPALESLKQSQDYGIHFPPLVLSFLKSLNPWEREAFNIAAGMATLNLERCRIPSSQEALGFLLLEASDLPLPDSDFAVPQRPSLDPNELILSGDVFFRGWYSVENNEDAYSRWSGKEGYLRLCDRQGCTLHLSIFSHHPDVCERPVDVLLFRLDAGEALVERLSLYSRRPVEVTVPVDRDDFVLKIYAANTWIPKYFEMSDDARELGIGVKWAYLS